MKKIIFIALLLSIIICLLLYGWNKKPEKSEKPEFLSLEGKSDNWTVFTSIPYTVKSDDKYFKVIFKCNSVDQLFSERDIIGFAIGTSIASVVYSYRKNEGFIRSDYSSDPADLERITRVSDDTFEVLYDRNIINTSIKASQQLINIQIAEGKNESINLLPVKGRSSE